MKYLFGWINILYDRIKYYSPRLSAHINLPVKERPTKKWNTMFHFFIAENSGSISEMCFISAWVVMTKIMYLILYHILFHM